MGLSMCGWCATNHHDDCIKEIKHFDTIWRCQCEKCSVPKGEDNEAPL